MNTLLTHYSMGIGLLRKKILNEILNDLFRFIYIK